MSRHPFQCCDCGARRKFAYASSTVRIDHHCPDCDRMTAHERADYDPTVRDAPVEEVAAETAAMGWRENADGKLVIGGEPAEGVDDA